MSDDQILQSISPFFIVREFSESIDFYCGKLGFNVVFQQPDKDPFVGMVQRDGISIMLKEIAPEVPPQPNHTKHEWARWDAFIQVGNPDSLFEEYKANGVRFHSELSDTDDGIRAFEILDVDGYVICFGRLL